MQKKKVRFFPVEWFFEDAQMLRSFVEGGVNAIQQYRVPPALNAAIVNSIGRNWKLALVLESGMADGFDFQRVANALGHLLKSRFDLAFGSVEVIRTEGPNPTPIWNFANGHGVDLEKSEFTQPPNPTAYEGALATAGVRKSVSLDQIARLPI
ncbi:MAG: hypothetical protein A3C90_02695 [Candidatus Magasanikbacteria bacterium RIFCSPHIGHO2_02_FULL_51_14]|uniref:Uncharacterized protein n=1 Tax=Candidatus Magasanikbacteria bacterium RIFCSPHIGHO2_02_FULL_51_14 TaxID=1798683 RepID=A0A1F6MP02_9BACT|nr:MAG: hypothetical protein A3C90_02695 [Candidatus Magasanikbacteria bacterium RIFCSPHIGHO2_02_FULL_51_14]